MPVCKYFSSQSGCIRGDQCYFQHVRPEGQGNFDSTRELSSSWRTPHSNSTRPASTSLIGPADPLADVKCRFFIAGACKYGDACRFRHQSKSDEKTPDESFPQLARKKHSGLRLRLTHAGSIQGAASEAKRIKYPGFGRRSRGVWRRGRRSQHPTGCRLDCSFTDVQCHLHLVPTIENCDAPVFFLAVHGRDCTKAY